MTHRPIAALRNFRNKAALSVQLLYLLIERHRADEQVGPLVRPNDLSIQGSCCATRAVETKAEANAEPTAIRTRPPWIRIPQFGIGIL